MGDFERTFGAGADFERTFGAGADFDRIIDENNSEYFREDRRKTKNS
ncbi:hypothetical protein GJY23_22490, partial [Salmonella enterica]|nr:hypothetical protein [Salmonella enterica]